MRWLGNMERSSAERPARRCYDAGVAMNRAKDRLHYKWLDGVRRVWPSSRTVYELVAVQ